MLDFIRNHQRWAMIILAVLIVPGLGLIGIQGLQGFFSDNSSNVASVDGHAISRLQFDNVMQQQAARLRQLAGSAFDPATLNDPKVREAVLDQMIQQRTVADETQRLKLTASNQAVIHYELSIPAIAQMRNSDGSINTQLLARMLAQQGLTPEQLDEGVRNQLAQQQLATNIAGSAFVSKTVAQRIGLLMQQQREVQQLSFKPQSYIARVDQSPAAIKAYYAAHTKDFEKPETAQIDYVVLSQSALAAAYHPSDSELQQYYQSNIARYRTKEQVRASHILIAVPKDASAQELATAQQKASAILAEVRAHPSHFATLAKQDSQDPGSAAQGGDLGFFGRDMMVKPFEDAAFSLKKGQISDLVRTDFGFHIIQVTDIRPATTQPFEAVKGSIAVALQAQHGTQQFANSMEGFSDMVYQAPANSLQPAANQYHLTIQHATVTRQPNPALAATDPLNNPQFLKAVFSNDAVKNGHNTDAIDVGNNTLIAARVTRHTPAEVPELNTIQAQVKQRYLAEQTEQLARQAGTAKLAQLQKTLSADGFSAAAKISRDENSPAFPSAAVAQIFKLGDQPLPQYAGVDLGANGYRIYRLNKIDQSKEIDPDKLAAITRQLTQLAAQGELTAYYASLRARSNVKLYKDSLNNTTNPVTDSTTD